MIVEELVAKLGLEIDSGALSTLERFRSGMVKGLGGIAIAAGAVAAAFAGIVGSVGAAADEIGDVSEKLGVAPKALQELKFAAERTEVSFEGLQQGLKAVAKHAVEAANGSDTFKEAFSGVALRDSAGKIKTADALLLSVAERFQKLPDEATRTNVALKIFGRVGADMVPLLMKGSAGIAELSKQAHDLGLVFDDTTVALGGRFDEALKDVRSAFVGLRNVFGVRFLPIMTAGLELLAKGVQALRPHIDAIGEGFELASHIITFAAGFIVGVVEGIAEKLGISNDELAEMVPTLETIRNVTAAILVGLAGGLAIMGVIGTITTALGVIAKIWGGIQTLAWGFALAVGAVGSALGIGVIPAIGIVLGLVALVGAAVYDVYNILTGQEPVIFNTKHWDILYGRIIALKDLFLNTMDFVGQSITRLLGDAFRAVIDNVPFLKPLLELLGNGAQGAANALGFGDKFSAFKEKSADVFGFRGTGSIDRSAQRMTDAFDALTKPWNGGAAGPNAAGAIASTPNQTDARSVAQTNNISINASNMDPKELSSQISKTLQSEYQSAFASYPNG